MAVELRDVTLRDGLQDEAILATSDKVALLIALADAGLQQLEIGSFVRADLVPAMADTAELVAAARDLDLGMALWGLVLNVRGADRARRAGVERLQFVVSVSEAHNRRNAGRTVAESLNELARILQGSSASEDIEVTLATAFGCPYTGPVRQEEVVRLAEGVLDTGVTRLTLADTIGVAVPREVASLASSVAALSPEVGLGLHLHDTRGTALANAFAGLGAGVRRFDGSTSGLGGCPFAPGATGNLALEDLVHAFEATGERTGIDLAKLLEAGRLASGLLGREPDSHIARAGPRFASLRPGFSD